MNPARTGPGYGLRVRMRTNGPPVPLEHNEGVPHRGDETFLQMTLRQLPMILLVVSMAVFCGSIVGQLLAPWYSAI
ncbi:MAG: hypothetical protein HY020_02780 [Burkholderiales bacterium]|nr:hypothetical protein [Burkholderiales bacterium]